MEGLIFDVSHRLEDFAVAADIISQLDLVISVDSAIAHLAGAMGKPCFMLSPFTRCWRWWNKTSGWPWYNRMTLFHQVESGSWNLAMRRIVEDVKKGRVK
jgi:ADP-heptose:LPS heptosyltransferase